MHVLFLSLRAISVLVPTALVSTTYAQGAPSIAPRTDVDWQKLMPGPTLSWVKCFNTRECARLEVPLDYSDPSGDKAVVALLRVKAKVPPQSKSYRGPLLYNPGGPGISGVQDVNANGDRYQKIVGEAFDIVGFDPRGVGETTPQVSVFFDVAERAAWDGGAVPTVNSTPDALAQGFVRAQLFNALIENRAKRVAEHVSAAVVARDMLSIIKAHGRDRLQYWGISYGTVLGATFAAMFPNNVERLMIDGVVDLDDYFSGSFSTPLLDTDKGLQLLYDQCAKVGPACPLQARSGISVRDRVNAVISSIKAKPMSVINGTDYAVIDFTTLKQALYQTLYAPFSLFPQAADALAALESGDGRPFLTFWRSLTSLSKCDTPPQPGSTAEEAGQAITCGDATGVNNSIPDILRFFQEQSSISIFADVWTDMARTSCAGWKVRAKERFAGPFAVSTSFPLLIVGNIADPVTPLEGAHKAVRTFAGSALLTINTPGHTSQAANSVCVDKIVGNYFRKGKLPFPGTVCEVEDVLFGRPITFSGNSISKG